MTNKLKLLMATSLVAFVTTGCSTAPAPWAQTKNGSTGGKGVTHSHNGQVHTHPLPSSGIHHSHTQGGATGNTNNNNSSNNAACVTHTHDGITHTHPLPSSGLNHSHGGGYGKAVGGSNNNNRNDTYTYTYGDYGNNNRGSYYNDGYYDSEYGKNSNSNSSDRYNDNNYGGSGRDTYYDSRRDDNRNDSSDYASSIDSSSNYDGGDTYTVRRKDTVFEVMRQTGAYWKDIIRLNDLKAPKYEIQPGQKLKLPKDRD